MTHEKEDECAEVRLIRMISAASTETDDKLLRYMDKYKLPRLMDATLETLEEFARGEGLI